MRARFLLVNEGERGIHGSLRLADPLGSRRRERFEGPQRRPLTTTERAASAPLAEAGEVLVDAAEGVLEVMHGSSPAMTRPTRAAAKGWVKDIDARSPSAGTV